MSPDVSGHESASGSPAKPNLPNVALDLRCHLEVKRSLGEPLQVVKWGFVACGAEQRSGAALQEQRVPKNPNDSTRRRSSELVASNPPIRVISCVLNRSGGDVQAIVEA
jgi:hypothetical protein